jgi:hypothetical protein
LGEEIVGVGGVVKASPELLKHTTGSKIDMSKVSVHLHTKSGLLKSTTECAPNGYYFLRIYEEGTFLVRVEGPAGWSVTPSEAKVVITKESPNIKDDVNFWFNGFAVTGKVVSLGQEKGPEGVELTLTGVGGQSTSAKSGPDGSFTLSGIAPGKYEVKAQHPYIEGSMSVVVKGGNEELKKPFVVAGYDLEGSVKTSEGTPISDVVVMVFGKKGTNILGCSESGSGSKVKGETPLCSVRTNSDGRFSFKKVPHGAYTLKSLYSHSQRSFNLSPEELPVTVSHAPVFLDGAFRVLGFSISGRALHASGAGISDASILVNNEVRAKTAKDGSYHIQLEFGSYSLSAQKKDHKFRKLADVKVQADMSGLPDIMASSYAVCGTVLPPDGSSKPGRYQVKLHPRGASKSSISTQATTSSEDGKFCFDVPAGSYSLSPHSLGGATLPAGLSPERYDIDVKDSPIHTVTFTQARVTVSGVVKCIEHLCDPSLLVTLSAEGHSEVFSAAVNSNGSFTFKDINPGQYRASISLQDTWCWEKKSISVMLDKGKAAGLEFRQSGYVLQAMLSHDIDLLFTRENAKATPPQSFSLKKGHNKFCLSQPGSYTIDPKACYMFEQDVFKYDTSSPRMLDFEVTHYRISGTIEATQNTGIKVEVRATKGQDTHTVEVDPTVVEEKKTPQGGRITVLQYAYFARMNEQAEFTPRSDALLFYPRSVSRTITEPACPSPLAPIEARPGRVIEGSVTPELEGVTISVQNKTSGEIVATVETTKDGRYTAGPLYDDFPAKLFAKKEGYMFKHETDGHFRAVQLSRVSVKVTDEDKKPLSGVLLSLSGDYLRNHNATDERGMFSYVDIAAGGYYLRPSLKEYVFDPPATEVTVEEGVVSSISLTAKRVAWSCFGSVTSLNGEAEKGVVVEAIGPNKEHEESRTDAAGNFRLRGLKPEKVYTLRVSAGDDNPQVERAAPVEQSIQVSQKDYSGVEFVVFRHSTYHDLTGIVTLNIEGNEDLLSHLPSIEVYLEAKGQKGGKDKVAKTTELGVSRFFVFSDLPEGQYIVKARFKAKRGENLNKMYQIKAPTAEVMLTASSAPVHVTFSASVREASEDIDSFGADKFILIILVLLMVLNPDKSWKLAEYVCFLITTRFMGDDEATSARAAGMAGKSKSGSGKVKRK